MDDVITKRDQLITADDAARISREYGLADCDAHWWKVQGDKGKLPSVSVKRRRRFLRSHVEAYIRRRVDFLIARTPRDLHPWWRR